MTTGVYEILNKVSGHRYIGSSVRVEIRLNDHLKALENNTHCNQHLQRAWNSYSGKDSFAFKILEECSRDRKSLVSLEQHYIDILKPEYNILQIAGSPAGYSPTQETRSKISEANKGRIVSQETRAKIGAAQKGKKVSLDTRAKLSATMKGKPCLESVKVKLHARKGTVKYSKERSERISEALKGKKFTDERRKRISEVVKEYWARYHAGDETCEREPPGSRKNKPCSDKRKKAVSDAFANRRKMGLKNKPISEEQRKARGEARKGKPLSDAHKAAIAAGWIKRRAEKAAAKLAGEQNVEI